MVRGESGAEGPHYPASRVTPFSDRSSLTADSAQLSSTTTLLTLRRDRWRIFNLCFTQILGSFFGRRGVLVEACSPLEAGCLGEPRHKLDVPVVMVHGCFLYGSGMNHQVIGWIVEYLVGADQEVLQGLRQSLINLR